MVARFPYRADYRTFMKAKKIIRVRRLPARRAGLSPEVHFRAGWQMQGTEINSESSSKRGCAYFLGTSIKGW
jgi:hypothetical protein